MTKERGIAIELLRGLKEKRISIQEVISNWPFKKEDECLERIRCLLDHYSDDEDIRKKDPRYAKWEEEQLIKYIGDLEREKAGDRENKMADQLKLYEKAGRVIRLFAWLSLVAVVGVVIAILIPIMAGGVQIESASIVGPFFVLLLVSLFTYFQFSLGAAIKEHKEWGRKVGIVYSVLQLFGFPIGTIVGGYILYCLIKGWEEKK